jgi:cytochrome c oxidase cbb3-type subunit 3/ubiquinol-cytochrome c reductase cytochrome c subunit
MRSVWVVACLFSLLLGCGRRVEQYVLPSQIADFRALYETNCAGCHGVDGRRGAARPLNDPLYLALVGKDRLRAVIARGVPGTAMPAFAPNAGGTLTDQQIATLADQIEAQWGRPINLAELPLYTADAGDAAKGEAVFNRACSGCHGEKGIGGSLINTDFLALVSDQSLRTTVIAGRSDRSMPDWRTHKPALTRQDVSDVVAWLSAHRRGAFNLTKLGANLP